MNQYYGVTETGQTRYVAMSIEEVEEYAKKHPEEEIIRIEDKLGSIKKSLREYIEPAYTGSGHKVKDATSDKFNIGDRVQFDDGDWKNRTGTIKDIFENNYGIACAEVTFDHAFKNHPGGTTMALKSLRKLDESFTRKTLRESLKDWDRKEFEENSNSYELEMLYESVKTILSAQQKNDLARFVRKAKTAEEVNTYMTGMLAQGQMNEAFDKEPHEFWYYTKHGLGPGTVPRDVEILDIKEDDNWGTYIKLDKVLTTDELEYYDLKERAPKLEEANEGVGLDINWAFESLRNFLMEANPRFCEEMEINEENGTIVVFIDYGDWKHDHYYLNSLIKEWASSNNIECSIEEYVIFEDGSDTYSAEHIISFEDALEEGYVAQKPQRFTNGQLKDFDPYAFIKLIMRSGKSMNSVRDCGPYQYTIFVNYKEHFGPRGADDPDTLYMVDIIREDQSGNQFQDIIEKDLLWTEVAETLQEWKEETILANDMRKNAAMPY